MLKSNVGEALLSVRGLCVHFPIRQPGALPWAPPGMLRAVDGVSFDLQAGASLGIIGESGSGKTTLARAIMCTVPVSAGQVLWVGENLPELGTRDRRLKRRGIQMVYQDPLSSLNPRMTVGRIVDEPLRTHFPDMDRAERARRVRGILQKVGLPPDMLNRYPHQFSGGQCQRIGIARALITEPRLLICDEPVSSLDVSVRARILELLGCLRKEMGLSMLFIAHDLGVVQEVCDRTMVMRAGRAVEMQDTCSLIRSPKADYTRSLLAAVPFPDPKVERRRIARRRAGSRCATGAEPQPAARAGNSPG